MLNPTIADHQKLQSWPMINDPLAAIKCFKPINLWLRWLKPIHLYTHYLYYKKRRLMAKSSVDMQKFYSQADMTIDKNRWDYLKLRKSWYIAPLQWEKFADKKCSKILDAGCGDGDVTQRVVDAIEKEWSRDTNLIHKIEIVGIDLNASRVGNAKNLCSSKFKEITFNFLSVDAGQNIPFPERYFDYALCTGVLEILADKPAQTLIKNLCRVVSKAIYVEDLADRYPGGYPRPDLNCLFSPNEFRVKERHLELNEPFSLFHIPDPCWKEMKWSVQKIQVLWAERENTVAIST
jgi:ubiquinone/menaquinone biosynthesis C-methylase UbiE